MADLDRAIWCALNEQADLGIITTDTQLHIRSWNPWLETRSSLRSVEMVGRHLLEAFPDLPARHLDQHYQEALAGNTVFLPQSVQHYLLPMPPTLEDTGLDHMQQNARIAPLLDHGQTVGTLTVIEDVTERVIREAKLQQYISKPTATEETFHLSESHFRSIIEHTSDIICILDAEGTLHYVSPSVERNLGYQPAEWIGRNVFHLIHTDDIPTVMKNLQGSMRQAGPASPLQFRIRHRDGTWRIHEAAGSELPDISSPPRVVMNTRDITSRKEAEQAFAHEVKVNAALAQLSTALLSEASIEEISADLLLHAQRLTESPYGFVGYIDSLTGHLVSPTLTRDIWEDCQVPGKKAVFSEISGLWGWVLRHRETLITNNPADDSRSMGTPPGHIPIQRFLSVPAMIGDTLVGQIALANAPRNYNERDVALVRRLAIIAAIAFQNRQAENALREERNFVSAVLDTAGALVVVSDRDGRIERFNRACERITGYSFEEVRGKPVCDVFVLPEEKDRVAAAFTELQGGRPIHESETHWVTKNGERRLIAWSNTVLLDDAGLVRHIIGTGIDVTERRRVEQALQTSKEKLTAWVNELEMRNRDITLLNEMTDLLQTCIDDRETNAVIAQSLPQIFTAESGALYVLSESRNFLEAVVSWGDTLQIEKIFRPQECWALRRARLHVVEGTGVGLRCSHVDPAVAGTYLCMPMMAQGEAIGLLHLTSGTSPGKLSETKQRMAVTVTEHIGLALANLKLRETLRDQSVRDPLTGLFNRRFMEESLERELSRATRSQRTLGLIMIDIDHFKHFNDTYGHEAGDTLLRELGGFLQINVREGDIACRYGGEEFILILPEVTISAAVQRAEQLREEFKHRIVKYDGQSLGTITLSFGVALFPLHAATTDALLRQADKALYRAKEAGRDRVETASQE